MIQALAGPSDLIDMPCRILRRSNQEHENRASRALHRAPMWACSALLGLTVSGCSTQILGQNDPQGCDEPNAVGCEPAPANGGSGGSSGASGGSGSGAGSGGVAGSGGGGNVVLKDWGPFIMGADISWTLEDERGGATYFDAGVRKDLVEILDDHGFNYVRLRLFVDPGAPGGYAYGGLESWNDLAHTIAMAERLRTYGMGFLLNFHYSDTWADPGQQAIPQAWRNLSFEQLQDRLYDYTRESLEAMRDAGVSPQMVQVGNEITSGMLIPHGASTPDSNWPRLAALLKAGVAAVRDTDPNIGVILQLDKCNDNGASRWWLDNAIEEGVEFDILAQSCYTAYQGTPPEWRSNLLDLAERYPNLQFVVGEYSHEKRAANQIMFDLPDERGLGSFIWEPTRWMESIFDAASGKSYQTNALIDLYPQMVSDYAR